MAFYESTIIIRQDIASSEVDKITADIADLIKNHDGEVIKSEYWGLKHLAYEIQNNKKGHYHFMGIKADKPLLDELDRKFKLSEGIIRSSLIRVDEIDKSTAPILESQKDDGGKTIDVTSNKSS
ncbi:30S ribosomal protein S6 [Rickettsiaceae bacterium]|nr:30S ribosomal protein S6 [Rickettsiaceae bacterium]